MQNRIGELFSLVRFLQVRPFSDYMCKKCACSMLHWELDEKHMCKECHHPGIQHVSVFNQVSGVEWRGASVEIQSQLTGITPGTVEPAHAE